MSKLDAVRAMREARYAETQARASTTAGRPATAAPRKATTPPVAPVEDAAATDDLCGHRNISGRTCTRERGHAAKTHRYS